MPGVPALQAATRLPPAVHSMSRQQPIIREANKQTKQEHQCTNHTLFACRHTTRQQSKQHARHQAVPLWHTTRTTPRMRSHRKTALPTRKPSELQASAASALQSAKHTVQLHVHARCCSVVRDMPAQPLVGWAYPVAPASTCMHVQLRRVFSSTRAS